ncbi:hypothetical protein MKW98_021013 [Papaver atlanticum]|uniref:Myb-like domain-containing protein n=1 Tax=Papaver atlanticum TaxID=357466 RepID=A0AAD4XHB4_9MAGN|nr:hypothetical protein MKW98_021013 [Papaver atlanticum]
MRNDEYFFKVDQSERGRRESRQSQLKQIFFNFSKQLQRLFEVQFQVVTMKNCAKKNRKKYQTERKKKYSRFNLKKKLKERKAEKRAAAENTAVPVVTQDPALHPTCIAAVNTGCSCYVKDKRPKQKWSIEEEAMLKALLLKHKGTFKVAGPWERIQCEGRHVFKESREGADLRYKWKNMLPQWLKESSGT